MFSRELKETNSQQQGSHLKRNITNEDLESLTKALSNISDNSVNFSSDALLGLLKAFSSSYFNISDKVRAMLDWTKPSESSFPLSEKIIWSSLNSMVILSKALGSAQLKPEDLEDYDYGRLCERIVEDTKIYLSYSFLQGKVNPQLAEKDLICSLLSLIPSLDSKYNKELGDMEGKKPFIEGLWELIENLALINPECAEGLISPATLQSWLEKKIYTSKVVNEGFFEESKGKETEILSKKENKTSEVELKEKYLPEETDKREHPLKVIWEWQSNARPWSSEPTQWTPYNSQDNEILEKAYSDKVNKVNMVDIGDYLVFIEDKAMFQQRKDYVFSQRRVRRIEGVIMSKELNMRSERFLVTEAPKTYSNAFGSLEDFLLFFQNRGPEIAEFVEIFTQIEKLNDCDTLNSKILPKIVESIRQEADKKAREKDYTVLPSYTALFQKDFTSLKDFYGDILEAYTQNGFLYLNLNKYLRDEDWIQLDTLLPYAFCLCKAFLCTDSIFDAQKQPNSAAGSEKNKTFLLYRGGLFDKDLLERYDPNKISHFSWNGVTSTTMDPGIAKIFMDGSKKKTPVMFIIEVPANPDEQRKVNMLNIKPFSVLPGEEEVVLAPGSIFEVVNFQKNGKEAEIKLKLVTDPKKLAHHGKIMHGTMQSEVSSGKVAKIVGLGERELIESITHLRGNRLIEELELSLCKFDMYTEKVLQEILPTISSLSKISFISMFSDENIHLNIIFKVISGLDIKNMHISEQSPENQIIPSLNGSKCLNSLINLTLDLKQSKDFTREVMINLSSQVLQHIVSLKTLNLDFSESQITDDVVETLCSQGLSRLTSLTDLCLNFAECKKISDQALNFLGSEGLRHMVSLINLDIDFSSCFKIEGEGPTNLFAHGIRYLTITTLKLNFKNCHLTDKALSNLSSQGLRYMISLTDLSLCFEQCQEIADEGVEALSSQAIPCLVNLRTLNLNFRGCKEIEDNGVKCLGMQGISSLNSLTCLYLDFDDCRWITDEGINTLFSTGITCLTSLKTLDLKLGVSAQISGRKYFGLEKVKSLKFLNELSLDCSMWDLTDESWNHIGSQVFRNMASLTSLNLTFTNCESFTDVTMNNLCFEGIQYLTSLTTLNLNFLGCQNITDNGVTTLCANGIQHLASLTTLKLCFSYCSKLTDESLKSLCFQGLNYVTLLENLDLDFMECYSVSDKGVHVLCSQGLGLLASLSTLKLNLLHCMKVKYQGLEELRLATQNIKNCRILLNCDEVSHKSRPFGQFSVNRYLHNEQQNKFVAKDNFLALDNIEEVNHFYRNLAVNNQFHSLTSLDLTFPTMFCETHPALDFLSLTDFKYLTTLRTLRVKFLFVCKQFVPILCFQGLRYLTSLTTLDLDFTHVTIITDDSVSRLCLEGIKYLTLLNTLHINFNLCRDITSKGLENLCLQGLKHLTFLTDLDLNFSDCGKIMDNGVFALNFKGLGLANSLTFLNLNFSGCSISDKGVETLYSQAIKHLIKLTTLKLNFSKSERITDEPIRSLCLVGLNNMTTLTTLSLEFGESQDSQNSQNSQNFQNFSNFGMKSFGMLPPRQPINILWSQRLKFHNTITSLSLKFARCPNITDEGLINLAQGIRSLHSLTYFALGFQSCEAITNKGVSILCSEGLRYLTSLTVLHLQISSRNNITDEGIKDMCSNGIRYLTSLTTLSLDLSDCKNITDEGIKHLCFLGIKYLTLLKSLEMDFTYCPRISSVGFRNLRIFLKYFGYKFDKIFKEHYKFSDSFEI